MHRLFLAAAEFLLFTAAACAADLTAAPTKAPAASVTTACTTNQCDVWFLGAGLFGAGSNVDILGQGIDNSVFADGGMISADLGAQVWYNGIFLGAEDMLGYSFGAPASVSNGSADISGGLDVLWFEAGGSLGDLFGSGATPVTINNALTSDLISLYFGTGPALPFGDSSLGTASFWTSGAGARYLIPTGAHPILLDLKYIYGLDNNTTGLTANKSVQFVGGSVDVPFNW